jgi:tRNA(fMet)-specific endonuclease VapC
MLLGTIGRKASPRHASLVEAFVVRLSEVLPWDRRAAEASMRIRKELAAGGTPIDGNDTMIAGHALAAGCTLVTNNLREFSRVKNLVAEDWTAA